MPPFVPARRSRRQSAPAIIRVSTPLGDLPAIAGPYANEGDRPVPVRALCEELGVDVAPQLRKLRNYPWARIQQVRALAADDRARLLACIPMRAIPAWLASVSPRRIPPKALPGFSERWEGMLKSSIPLWPAWPSPASPPSPARELPPEPMQTSSRPSAAPLGARDMAAIEDELLFLKTQAGRLEAHAGLGEPVRHAIGELFERVERLERRLGLALVAPAWRPGGDAGPEEHHEGDVDPELGALRVAVRQMRDQVEALKGPIGVAPGDELPNPVVVAPRETAVTVPARVRAFLLECTEALETDVRGMRSSKPRGMTATELSVAYDAWAERRGIPTLGAHALAQQLVRTDTPRMQYRRRFYFAVRLRAVVPTA